MKKALPIIIGAVVILIAVVVMLVFVLTGNKDEATAPQLSVDGTWRIVSENANSEVRISENEFAVFDGTEMKMYRDDLTTPFATSKYNIDASGMLNLPDISREYMIEKVSDTMMKLCPDDNTVMYLVSWPNADMSATEFTADTLKGDWNVICHAGNANVVEKLSFDGTNMKDFRDGASEPAFDEAYTVEGNKISVPNLNLELIGYVGKNGNVYLVQVLDGNVWEISKIA